MKSTPNPATVFKTVVGLAAAVAFALSPSAVQVLTIIR